VLRHSTRIYYEKTNNKLKIAISLVGISSGIKNRDWNRTKYDIKEKVIDCWKDHEVITYVATNFLENNKIDPQLLKFYKPVKHTSASEGIGMQDRYEISLELLKDTEADFIICTRFDIIFFNEVSTFNIDYNKFNFLFREMNHFYDGRYYTCDNFYAFPKKYLNNFLQAIKTSTKPNKGHLHDKVYPGLKETIGEHSIHFIQEEDDYSGPPLNKFYLLDRYNTEDGDLGPTSINKLKDYINRI
jgi:hypothetical protein